MSGQTATEKRPLPAGAVEVFRPPSREALVQGGKLRIDEASAAAREKLLVIMVGAATEAIAGTIAATIQQQRGSLSPEEQRMHAALAESLTARARDPAVIEAAIKSATEMLEQWVRETRSGTAVGTRPSSNR